MPNKLKVSVRGRNQWNISFRCGLKCNFIAFWCVLWCKFHQNCRWNVRFFFFFRVICFSCRLFDYLLLFFPVDASIVKWITCLNVTHTYTRSHRIKCNRNCLELFFCPSHNDGAVVTLSHFERQVRAQVLIENGSKEFSLPHNEYVNWSIFMIFKT